MIFKVKNRKRVIISFITIVSILAMFISIFISHYSTSYALSKYGSRGQEVRTIQDKLKRWGYYKGNVDGIYGSQIQMMLIC